MQSNQNLDDNTILRHILESLISQVSNVKPLNKEIKQTLFSSEKIKNYIHENAQAFNIISELIKQCTKDNKVFNQRTISEGLAAKEEELQMFLATNKMEITPIDFHKILKVLDEEFENFPQELKHKIQEKTRVISPGILAVIDNEDHAISFLGITGIYALKNFSFDELICDPALVSMALDIMLQHQGAADIKNNILNNIENNRLPKIHSLLEQIRKISTDDLHLKTLEDLADSLAIAEESHDSLELLKKRVNVIAKLVENRLIEALPSEYQNEIENNIQKWEEEITDFSEQIHKLMANKFQQKYSQQQAISSTHLDEDKDAISNSPKF